MIRVVVSDLGNVILSFDNRIFFKKLSSYCSLSEEEIAELAFNRFDLIESFDTGKISPQDFFLKVTGILKAKVDYDDFFAIYNDVFFLNQPVLKIMKRLKAKYKLILLSNTDIMRFTFIRKKFPEILIFDNYILSFEIGFMKPHPQVYECALKKAEARASECVFIDDIEANIDAASKLGLNTILFKPETNLATVLQDLGLFFWSKSKIKY